MATFSRVCIWTLFLAAAVLLSPARAEDAGGEADAGGEEPSAVLVLDASNFTDAVATHQFIVVEFYAPWCGHCKQLAPAYEKAAAILSKHNPPVVLAKVDANDETNKEIANKYEVQGYPTLKILRNQGNDVRDYKGPRDADGIVEYLKKQVGPASTEIKSSEDASILIGDQKIVIVGVFPKYSGEEFENFMKVADKLRSDYDFGHTLDAKLLPHGDKSVSGPVVRLFKPFDERFVDFQSFHVDALESSIEVASVPVVTTFNDDPNNQPYLMKYFERPDTKVMLFLNFSSEHFDAFNSNYHNAAEHYKVKNMSFLIGDLDASHGALQYFGLKEDQAPLIIVQENDGQKYLKQTLDPDQIATWLKEYMDGSLTPFRKSEPIPEVNDEPVKVVVADSLQDVVFNSGKNVMLEFYAPWCGHCRKLAPILEEVAVSFKNDDDVIIAKMDATANDVPKDFDVQGYPTLYFYSASGKLAQYDGGRTAEDIIEFIKKSRDSKTLSEPVKDDMKIESEHVKEDMTIQSEPIKDEL